jgi:hypothetical protein
MVYHQENQRGVKAKKIMQPECLIRSKPFVFQKQVISFVKN